MRYNFHILLFSFLISGVFHSLLFGQTSRTFSDWQDEIQVVIQEFDQSKGLPVISLSDLIMGADGYMYIASSAGVSRFNGEHFQLISSEQFPSIRSNRFQHVYASHDSAIWMVDEQGFFSRWKKGSVVSFPELHQTNARPDWLLRVSNTGHAWICDGFSLKVYSEGKGFVHATDSLRDPIIDFLPLSNKQVLILTRRGLFRYWQPQNIFTSELLATDIPIDITRTGLWETNMVELSGNRAMIFNFDQLMIYNLGNGSSRLYRLPEKMTTTPISIIEADSTLLLLHSFNGHFDVDLKTGEITQFSGTTGREIDQLTYQTNWQGKRLYIAKCSVIFDNQIIYECDSNSRISEAVHDKEGNLWLSVAGRGLVRISISPFKVLSADNGLESGNTYSIIEDTSDAVWLASYESGIHRIKKNRIDFWGGNSSDLNNILIRALYERDDGTLFTASWDGGLSTFDGQQWNQFLLNDTLLLTQVEAFHTDTSGNFWIASRHGLYKQESDSAKFEFIYTQKNQPLLRVQVIRESKDGTLWFGTNGTGLFVKKKEIEYVGFDGLESELSIRDIFIEESTLWIATENHGLIRARFTEDDSLIDYKTINQSDGLYSLGIHRILIDEFGFFWLSSNHGIFRINTDELNKYLDNKTADIWIQSFTEEDGLPNREANGGVESSGLRTSGGSIWIPTQKGIVTIAPRQFLGKNPYRFTEIKASTITTEDSTYSLYSDSSLTINLGSRSLNINFDLLHFTNPQSLKLEYRIPGIADRWQLLASGRELTITNIPPGTHTFETRIAGIPGVLHQGASFTVVAPYYFYETSWFPFLLAFFVLLVFALALVSIKRSASFREKKLNRKVNERTKSLSEQKIATEKALKTIQKQAGELEKLNEAKTDFFINITHELRTPLALIKGPLELLKDASNRKNIEPEEQLALIERNSNHLNDLIDRLLNLMQMETEQTDREIKPLDLVEIVKLRFSQFESSEQLENKKFVLQIDNQKVKVLADPHALELILNNLISNAIKYTHPGDEIVISVGSKSGKSYFEIADTGIGIDKQELNFIFDPFYRSKNTGSVSGSGIGLSIVQKFMDQIAGTIHIDSEPNRGTKIRLSFPTPAETRKNKISSDRIAVFEQHKVKSEVEKDLLLAKSRIKNYTSKVTSSEQPSILIVDDNDDLRFFLARLLEENYNVTTVEKGSEALNQLNKKRFDLIISDVMMPEMDGITLAKHIREKTSHSSIPVILLSAKKTEKSITEGLTAGAQVYLTKPVQNRILFAQIDSLLTREQRLRRVTESIQPEKNEFLQRIDELILRHLSDTNLTIDTIAGTLHMSRSTLYRKWKKHSKISLNDHITSMRLKETILLIQSKDYTFAEASAVCGFSEPTYFSQVFKKVYKTTPTEYFDNLSEATH